ncbi:MAG: valine--tRNA ligase [Pseudomonadota bacterium]
MSRELQKAYEHDSVEARWYERWEQAGLFRAEDESDKPPFCLVIPPPNVTGVLHMGHALTYAIQDTVIRWKRMSGFNTLWLPGTDHAGIATQMLVARHLEKEEGLSRHDLGREAFVERVWEWKREYHARITRQSRRIGISVDWERERFTLDEGLSRAVREAFVTLYEEGLLYRARRMVNWSPGIHTVLSDLEVDHKEVPGHYWHIAYSVVGDEARRIVVATTRPETMLGDTAVAVHPDDERYADLIGRSVHLPLTGRTIPVIADGILADSGKGTGAVKVTPAHDPNDFECGKRNDLEFIDIFTDDATLNDAVPERYRGMERFAARARIVEDLEAAGVLVKVEEVTHSVGHCQRSGVMVEPKVSWQWFVQMGPPEDPSSIAGAAIEAVRDGRIRFIPERWTAEYHRWLEDIRDWCVSRQLWWGHRIPAWYCDGCGQITVARDDPAACGHCGGADIRQDDDVLDTWFSSGLWPFSTLGWPEKTRALETFYPNAIMETGFDILFFWVARMIMMGLKLNDNRVPFKDVYLHAMVRDAKGEKMSKTKGNVVDPLDVIEQAGADALRFTLLSLTAQGRDIKLSLDRVTGNRQFLNKIWNATRYVLMNIERTDGDVPRLDAVRDRLQIEDKWILDRLEKATASATKALEEYRFNEYAQGCYRFLWNEYCDWYLELSKNTLYGDDDDQKAVTLAVLVHALETSLRLLHPVIPFITEELWQKLPNRDGDSIMVAPWPGAGEGAYSKEADDFQVALDNLAAVRSVRSQNKLAPKTRVIATLRPKDDAVAALLSGARSFFESLAGVEELRIDAAAARPEASGAAVTPTAEIFVHLAGHVDLDAERARLAASMKKLEPEISGIVKKLANENFTSRAPAEVIESQQRRLDETQEQFDGLKAHLESIS